MSQPQIGMPGPLMPKGTEVASYATYNEAQAGVDYLSDNEFDVRSITIVGTDLHMVERVTGRRTMARSAMSGASSGAVWGGFMGMMLSFASQSTQSTLLYLAAGFLGGALIGMALAAFQYAMSGGRRDFTSQSQVIASRYAVLASADIDQAFRMLQKTPGNLMRPAPKRTRPESTGPTEYGSRPDEQPRFGVRVSQQPVESAPESAGIQGTAAAASATTPSTAASTDQEETMSSDSTAHSSSTVRGQSSSPDAASSVNATPKAPEAPVSSSPESSENSPQQ